MFSLFFQRPHCPRWVARHARGGGREGADTTTRRRWCTHWHRVHAPSGGANAHATRTAPPTDRALPRRAPTAARAAAPGQTGGQRARQRRRVRAMNRGRVRRCHVAPRRGRRGAGHALPHPRRDGIVGRDRRRGVSCLGGRGCPSNGADTPRGRPAGQMRPRACGASHSCSLPVASVAAGERNVSAEVADEEARHNGCRAMVMVMTVERWR